MTDRSISTPGPRVAPRTRGATAVYLVSVATFAAVTGFLGLRVSQGADPALGAKHAAAQVAPQPRRVLIRRVIVTKRVTVIKPAPRPKAAAVAAGAAPAQGASYAAPAPQYTAPSSSAPSAPAPAAAPAPAPAKAPAAAPAPAPVATATS